MAKTAGAAALQVDEAGQGADHRRGFEPRGSVGTHVQHDRHGMLSLDLRAERSPLQKLRARRVLEGPVDMMSVAKTDESNWASRARKTQAICRR